MNKHFCDGVWGGFLGNSDKGLGCLYFAAWMPKQFDLTINLKLSRWGIHFRLGLIFFVVDWTRRILADESTLW